jgi:hypothetical protein
VGDKTARAPRTPLIVPDQVAHRALSRWTLEAPTGCHISTYSTGSHGYAQIGWWEKPRNRMVLAHRAAWVAVFGQIPEGMTIDHVCKNRQCVNLEHLRMLTNYDNARRTSGRDWPLGQCVNGHPDSEAVLSGAKRVCRICRAEWQRRYRANREARSA